MDLLSVRALRHQDTTSHLEHQIKVSMMANNKIIVAILAIFLLLTGYHLGKDIQSWSYTSGEQPVTHVVLFQYKKKASPEDIAETNRQMLALKEKCIHPVSNRRYIKSLKGGKDNSIEGQQNGATYGFVVEFRSEEDRNWYVKDDEEHQRFKERAGKVLQKAIVVDFANGIF